MTKRLAILGTRGIPASHGGFETFAEYLAAHMVSRGWHVTVYCQSDQFNKTETWNGIECVSLKPWGKGAFGTFVFDAMAIFHCLRNPESVMLTLGYNSGILNVIPRLFGRKQIINMDGIEWRRGKWSSFYKIMFYINYMFAGWSGNRLVGDNPGIENMLRHDFSVPKIDMIAYGAERIVDADRSLLKDIGLTDARYALIVARAEPENNILEIIQAWSKKQRHMKLVVLGPFKPNNAYHRACVLTASSEVLFPGALYDRKTVQSLRVHADLYLHGHSVGGTNPSLVEALSAARPIWAHDNVFNRWVAGEAAEYFYGRESLEALLDRLPISQTNNDVARMRHERYFTWDLVLGDYEALIQSML